MAERALLTNESLSPISSRQLADQVERALAETIARTHNIDSEEESVESLRLQLLEQKDRFGKVFITEKGSTYFVTKGGAGLRFRAHSYGKEKIQPLVQKSTLVDKATLGRIFEAQADGKTTLRNFGIVCAPYEIGSIPFEFGLANQDAISFEEQDAQLILKGGVPVYHVGHPIIEIIK